MGDRIGLKFRDDSGEESDIIVHSHWMGRDLLKLAQQFYRECPDSVKNAYVDEVTATFMLWMGNRVNDIFNIDIDLQTDDSDCEDNGVWTMNMKDGTVE